MRFFILPLVLCLTGEILADEIYQIAPLVVTSERRSIGESASPEFAPSQEPFAFGIAELLAEDPAFAIYRREGSRQANPTAQGISLGNTGATATSRTLVLRNGVPQNDPFGGWIYWTRLPKESIRSVDFLSPGQGLAWGSSSTGGVILIEDLSPFEAGGRIDLEVGDPGSLSAYARQNHVDDNLALSVEAFGANRDGFKRVHPSDRGPIDTEAELEYLGARLAAEWERENGRWLVEGSGYTEDRSNGLPQAENSTEAWDVSARRQFESADWAATAVAYGQYREFENTFSATDDARTSDSVVLDQFSVPAWSAGGAISFAGTLNEQSEFFGGLDARWIEGETNERFFNDGTIFRRQREGGGEQILAGAFAGIRWFRDTLDVEASGRLDYWQLYNGRLIVSDLTGGPAGSREDFSDRDEIEPSAQISFGWEPHPDWRLEVAAAQNFRLPTINELYRPFRIGNDTTLANAELEPEGFQSLRASADYSPKDSRLALDAAVTYYWIEDAVANVTLDPDPTGALAQRLNVPDAEVFGIEVGADYSLNDSIDLNVRYAYSRATFESTTGGVDINGNDFPLAPEHRITGSVNYKMGNWMAEIQARYESESFDDTNNLREIPDAFTLDAGLQFEINERTLIRVRAENLLDATIVSAEQASGIRFIAPGRSIYIGITHEI
ncbi:MAG: TonB-dependent receptor [Verrucomicrobiota bacterium]